MNDKIINEARARQLMLFEGMGRRRNITPTDIDLFLEYSGRLFIIGEGKVVGKDLEKGQRQAFENLCNIICKPTQPIYSCLWILHFEHNTKKDEDVMVKDQYVVNTYNSIDLIWKKPTDIDVIPKFETTNGKLTMLDAIIQIENWCEDNTKISV